MLFREMKKILTNKCTRIIYIIYTYTVVVNRFGLTPSSAFHSFARIHLFGVRICAMQPVTLNGAYVLHLVSLNFHNAKCIRTVHANGRRCRQEGRMEFSFLRFHPLRFREPLNPICCLYVLRCSSLSLSVFT